jgi:hypothetical protein
MKEKLQEAITLAVENHPGLERKAFMKTDAGWAVRPTITAQSYSTTERIVVGLLLELYNRCHGLPGIKYDPEEAEGKLPSEYIWSGATAAADLFDWLDAPQLAILKKLLPE